MCLVALGNELMTKGTTSQLLHVAESLFEIRREANRL